MNWQTALTLAPSAIAVIVAVAVPWMAFRLALRQDQIRRLFDKRADLYVDILTEAIAEQKYFEVDIADDDTRERMAVYYTDLRLQPFERARLGARANIFASPTVNRLFNRVQGEALNATLTGRPKDEGQRLVARLAVGKAVDELQDQVRAELGTDKIAPPR